MKTPLHERIAEALRRCESQARGGQPQWCFEIEGVESARGEQALYDLLLEWDCEFLFVSQKVGQTFEMAVVDSAELRTLIANAAESGYVVAVMDATTLGGCKFDFSSEGGSTQDLLVTCWGSRESTADYLRARLPEGVTFRGN